MKVGGLLAPDPLVIAGNFGRHRVSSLEMKYEKGYVHVLVLDSERCVSQYFPRKGKPAVTSPP